MRTKQRVLVSAGALAVTVLAAGCVPPGGPKPPTTTQPAKPGVASCPAVSDTTPGPNGTAPVGGSWGVNGQAKAVAVIGNVAYVGGSFTAAVPSAGAPAVGRGSLAAFCLANGALLNTFAANFGGGPVNALATDGVSLFVGGNFTTFNGAASNKLVKLNAATGAPDPNFSPLPIPAPVNPPPPNKQGIVSLAYAGGVIYAAGDFGKVGVSPAPAQSTAVDGAAGFNATTGVLSGFTAGANTKSVDAIAVGSNGVYIAGNFTTVKGQAHNGIARLSTAGAVDAVDFGAVNARALDLALSADSSQLFAAIGPKSTAGAPAGAGRRLVAFNTTSGNQVLNDTNPKGDPQAVEYVASTPAKAFYGMLLGYGTNNGPEIVGVNPAVAVGGAGYLSLQTISVSTTGVYDLAKGDATHAYFVAVGDFTSMGGVAGLHGVAIFK
jgi:hypothetical protein